MTDLLEPDSLLVEADVALSTRPKARAQTARSLQEESLNSPPSRLQRKPSEIALICLTARLPSRLALAPSPSQRASRSSGYAKCLYGAGGRRKREGKGVYGKREREEGARNRIVRGPTASPPLSRIRSH